MKKWIFFSLGRGIVSWKDDFPNYIYIIFRRKSSLEETIPPNFFFFEKIVSWRDDYSV